LKEQKQRKSLEHRIKEKLPERLLKKISALENTPEYLLRQERNVSILNSYLFLSL
jgi:hypothetical protein